MRSHVITRFETSGETEENVAMKPAYLLLTVTPLALALDYLAVNPVLVFSISALAIVPLASLLGEATENLARYLGPTIGGLLNATFGNAPEIIISMLTLSKGLVDVVKAAITGSIIGVLLLSLGLAMVVAGTRTKTPTFNAASASTSAGLLMVAGTALIVPALFHHSSAKAPGTDFFELSLAVAIILLVVYVLSLVFTLVTHRDLFQGQPANKDPENEGLPDEPQWTMRTATGVLVAVTIAVAFVSGALTDALAPTIEIMGLTPTFAGVILLAAVGNASDILNSIGFARKNKMDLAFGLATGAGTQVALLVVPVLVLGGYVMGQPMDLLFTEIEIAAIVLAILIVRHVASDGECYWIEGVMLLAVYLILAVGFFFAPA